MLLTAKSLYNSRVIVSLNKHLLKILSEQDAIFRDERHKASFKKVVLIQGLVGGWQVSRMTGRVAHELLHQGNTAGKKL